jgi:hypothetical protein
MSYTLTTKHSILHVIQGGEKVMKKMMKLFVVSAMAVSMFAGSAFANTTTPATPATPATTTTTPATPTTPATTTPATTTPATTTPATTTPATPAAEPKTAQEKFDVLKGKGIFTGLEDGSAGLDQDMTRAQAAAIVARLLGLKEDAAASSVYKDLTDAKWAAGFIGAVTPKYMQGVGSGKFDPSGKITIEQLATVMVRVLGLKIDEKATVVGASAWAQPYVSAALAAKLMAELPDYKNPAKRELLVETSYGAYVVVSKPVVPPAPPVSLEVDSVSSYSQTLVAVEVKTALTTAPDAKEFKVKDDAGKDVAVSAAALKNGGKTIVLTVAQMAAQKIHTLTFGGKDFKFVAVPTETNKPQLTSVVASNNKSVKVTFNENLDENALTITNYTIAGLQVLKAELDGTDKKVVILTTAAQTAGSIYKLVVTNVTDLAGNVIDADKDEMQFGGLAPDTTKPKLVSALATSNKVVQATFDEEVEEKTATTITNYTIAGLQVLKAAYKVDGDNKADKKVVELTTAAQTAGTIYSLVVANVTDVSGNVIDDGNKERKFGGLAPDTARPEVSGAVALTNTTVKVTFNEEVKKELAEDAKNYTIAGLTVSAAKFESDKKSVVLTTTAQTPGTIYTVLVINVQDISDNVINADKDEFKFGGIAADTTKPSVVSAEATNATTVKVTFSEPVDEVTAKQTFNYFLGTELGYPTAVAKDTVVTTGAVWVLTTASQKRITYTLDVTGVKDLSGNVLDEDKDEAKFAGNGASDTNAPKVTSAVALNKQEIRITFDEELMNSSAQGATEIQKITKEDFAFTYVSGVADVAAANTIVGQTPTAVVVADDKRSVTVTFANSVPANDVRETAAGAIYRVTVSGVEDAVGNDIGTTNNTADFVGINQANSKPSITFAQALDAQTLKLTFSEKIKKTDLVIGEFTFSPAVAFGPLVSQVVAKDGLSATFYFNGASFVAGTVYTVQISAAGVAKITDEAGLQTLDVKSGQTFAETVFAGNGTAPDAVKVTSIVALNVNTIDITFNKPINKRSTINNGIIESVTLDNGGTFTAPAVALVRTEGDDGNKLRMFFNDTTNKFSAGAIYRVKLVEAQVIDNNDKVMLPADDSGVFAASSVANDRPKMVSAVARPNGNTVEVEFSEALKAGGVNGVDGLTTGSFSLTASNNATISSVALKADSGNKVVILTLSGAQTPNALITVTFVDTNTNTPNTEVYDEAGVASVDPSVTVQYVADYL